ncbi:general substrate transporter [Hortaea werneckii]|nr:general substrate transporter [Hortaea werneckii]KAI7005772.1 general substrate transporter [Hortaea werneckii]KAI7666233.1 general substrate transporter [Hortaea werneckii]
MTFLTGKALNWAITATAGCGFLLFGYDQGVMSGLLTGDAFVATFPEINTNDGGNGSSSLQGTVVAIYEIGCFFGAGFTLFAGEKLGRRWMIMLGSVILAIGAVLQAAAYGIPQLIVGRIVAGLGNGMNTATIPVWHSELTKATDRGKSLSIELTINIFGVMTAYWVDYGMSYEPSAAQFRFPLALQILFAIMTFLGVLVLPESPRWLIAHDRLEEARKVLWSVSDNAKTVTMDDARLSRELAVIKHTIDEERIAAQGQSFMAIFKNGPQRFLYRTMLGIGGQFMQQISGVNLITYYNTVIFQKSVGLSRNLSLLLAGFNGVAYFFSTFVPIWTIDRLGRRTVHDGSTPAGIVATVMLFLFNFFFAVGLLAIAWLLPAEYTPLAIRTKAAALATASNWIFTFLVVEIVPVSIDNIGYKTYIYFAIFNFCFIQLIYFYYPETQRLSLEQIDKLFTGEKVLLHWQPSMDDAEIEMDHPEDLKEDQVDRIEGLGQAGPSKL